MHTPFAKFTTFLCLGREHQNPSEAFRDFTGAECSVNRAMLLVHPDLRGETANLFMA